MPRQTEPDKMVELAEGARKHNGYISFHRKSNNEIWDACQVTEATATTITFDCWRIGKGIVKVPVDDLHYVEV